MTPIELELLRLAAPIAAAIFATGSGIAVAGIKWYWSSVIRRIDSLSKIVNDVSDRLGSIESDMKTQMSEMQRQSQHRDDVMAGNIAARIERIEGICETQHGIRPLRRKADNASASWAQCSDVIGGSAK